VDGPCFDWPLYQQTTIYQIKLACANLNSVSNVICLLASSVVCLLGLRVSGALWVEGWSACATPTPKIAFGFGAHCPLANFVGNYSSLRAGLRLEQLRFVGYVVRAQDAIKVTLGALGEANMTIRLYLTIAAVVAILYALAFLLIPVQASLFFSGFAEPRAVLYLRFCGAAILAWGLIVWFARDFRSWDAVRGVLLASVVGLAVNIIINVWATLQGWLNGNAWGSTVVLALLFLGGIYELLVGQAREG
jgi:hypothetical protein